MKKIKTVIAVLALGALAATQAQAQLGDYRVMAQSSGVGTNVMHSGTATQTNQATLGGEYIGLQLDFKCIAACDSNVVVAIDKSLDGQTWQAFTTVTVTCNGTTPVTYVTNFTLASIPKVRTRTSTTATEAKAVTNLVLKVNTK